MPERRNYIYNSRNSLEVLANVYGSRQFIIYNSRNSLEVLAQL